MILLYQWFQTDYSPDCNWGGVGGNFRTSGFLPGISIYYNPPVYKFGKIISGVFQNLPNSCSFEPNIDFFLGIFHGPPFIITPRYGRNFQPPSFSIPPPYNYSRESRKGVRSIKRYLPSWNTKISTLQIIIVRGGGY